MGHDVGVDAEDGGVGGPDPGKIVVPELLDVTGQVDGLALGDSDVDDLGVADSSEVWTSVEPGVLTCSTDEGHISRVKRKEKQGLLTE